MEVVPIRVFNLFRISVTISIVISSLISGRVLAANAANPVKAQATPIPVASSVGSKPAVPAQVHCVGKNQQEMITIESSIFWRLIKQKTVNVYLADLQKCYYPGQIVKLFESKPFQKVNYWNYLRGWATVSNISEVKYREIRKLEAGKITDHEMKVIAGKLKKTTAKSDQELPELNVVRVSISSYRIEDHLATYGVPAKHAVAKALTKAELGVKLKEGSVYDVRPEAMRKVNPLENSRPLDIAAIEELAQKILSPKQLQEKGAHINSAKPPKITDSLTIVSNCWADFAAYNVVTLLHVRGYKNISWFPGGVEAFKQHPNPCGTPPKSAFATVVDGRGVAALKARQDTTVIDFRPTANFLIAGAVHIPFNQKVNPLLIPKLRHGITLEKLQKNDETFDISQLKKYPKTQAFVLYGANPFDWRPFKAAIILNSLGYKNLHWYRDGIDDWAQKVLTYPQYYTLNKSVPSQDLY